MPKLSSKHENNSINFNKMDGGINVSAYGDYIEDNELQECNNMYYERDTYTLRSRGGLSIPKITFTTNIKATFKDDETGIIFIFLENNDVYRTTNINDSIYIGKVNGDKYPECIKHVNKLFIASGGILQYYDFINNIKNVEDENAPIADVITSLYGRLLVSYEGSRYLDWSSWGDGTDWTLNTNDPSAAVKTEIGSDGGTIISFSRLSTDIMVFKNSGKVYQYSGYPPNEEQQQLIIDRPPALSPRSIKSLSTEVIYINESGLQQLTTTMEYGNITYGDAPLANKFNKIIKSDLYSPKIWELKRDKSVVIMPNSDIGKKLIIYNYIVGACTTWDFNDKITDLIELENEIIVAVGRNIHSLSLNNNKDFDTFPILWKMKFKRIESINLILLKEIDIMLDGDYVSEATLNLTKVARQVPIKKSKKIKLNHTSKYIEPVLFGTESVKFHHLIIIKAEV